MSLDEFLITNKEATYILKVNGASMIGAGILPGDMLLVERGAEPRDGDIVIAQVDREWTIKFFAKAWPHGIPGGSESGLQADLPDRGVKNRGGGACGYP